MANWRLAECKRTGNPPKSSGMSFGLESAQVGEAPVEKAPAEKALVEKAMVEDLYSIFLSHAKGASEFYIVHRLERNPGVVTSRI